MQGADLQKNLSTNLGRGVTNLKINIGKTYNILITYDFFLRCFLIGVYYRDALLKALMLSSCVGLLVFH